jgi:hypothetical protein
MEVDLTLDLEGVLQEKVRSGVYANTSHLLGDAVRHLRIESPQQREKLPLVDGCIFCGSVAPICDACGPRTRAYAIR